MHSFWKGTSLTYTPRSSSSTSRHDWRHIIHVSTHPWPWSWPGPAPHYAWPWSGATSISCDGRDSVIPGATAAAGNSPSVGDAISSSPTSSAAHAQWQTVTNVSRRGEVPHAHTRARSGARTWSTLKFKDSVLWLRTDYSGNMVVGYTRKM